MSHKLVISVGRLEHFTMVWVLTAPTFMIRGIIALTDCICSCALSSRITVIVTLCSMYITMEMLSIYIIDNKFPLRSKGSSFLPLPRSLLRMDTEKLNSNVNCANG